jgi:hypothetical protein
MIIERWGKEHKTKQPEKYEIRNFFSELSNLAKKAKETETKNTYYKNTQA